MMSLTVHHKVILMTTEMVKETEGLDRAMFRFVFLVIK